MPQPAASSLLYPWKPLVVCPHQQMSSQIRSALLDTGCADVGHIAEYPRTGTVAGLLAEHAYNICFLDVASNQEHALMLISEAARAIPVVALNPLNDADLILRCLRRGGSEFLSEVSSEQVKGVLERLAHLRSPSEHGKPAMVYCVLPGKAGSGASTLAVHLAAAVHRGSGGKVLLVDADCLTASIAFLMKLRSDFHLGDAVRDCDRLDEHVWSRMAVRHQGVDILTAPENPATRLEMDRQAALTLVRFWREHYAFVLLDLPDVQAAGYMLATLGDEILLVTTNELAALHATRRSLEFLEQNGLDSSHIKLIVTRYTPASGLKRDDLEKALRLAPYAVLSNDYAAVQHALLEGKLVAPGSAFGRSIEALSQRLLDKEKPHKKRSTWLGLIASRT
jgi:pilus assembly protein CpaE